MAITAATALDVRNGGSDTQCGGGFDSSFGGTDYSQQNTAQATGTVTSAGTTVTATTGIFTAAMVGNLITSGTVYKQITAFTSSTIVTVDSAPSWAAATIYVGGAFASPGKAASVQVAGSRIYLKYNATPYSMSSVSSNVANGAVSMAASSASASRTSLIGYDVTHGDRTANRPTLKATVNSLTMIIASTCCTVENLILDGDRANRSGILGVSTTGAGVTVNKCNLLNMSSGCVSATTASPELRNCFINNWASTGALISSGAGGFALFNCFVYDGQHDILTTTTGNSFRAIDSVFAKTASTRSMINQTTTNLNLIELTNCTVWGMGSDAIKFASACNANTPFIHNCIFYNNGGYGVNGSLANSGVGLIGINNAFGANTSGSYAASSFLYSLNEVTLTADPFTSAATGDFSLNNTAGGGAACRAAGSPGVFPGGLTTGYLDIGAAQHADPPAGGASYVEG